jgi:hypothetical protein
MFNVKWQRRGAHSTFTIHHSTFAFKTLRGGGGGDGGAEAEDRYVEAMLNVECSMLNGQRRGAHSTFNTQHSPFNIRL